MKLIVREFRSPWPGERGDQHRLAQGVLLDALYVVVLDSVQVPLPTQLIASDHGGRYGILVEGSSSVSDMLIEIAVQEAGETVVRICRIKPWSEPSHEGGLMFTSPRDVIATLKFLPDGRLSTIDRSEDRWWSEVGQAKP